MTTKTTIRDGPVTQARPNRKPLSRVPSEPNATLGAGTRPRARHSGTRIIHKRRCRCIRARKDRGENDVGGRRGALGSFLKNVLFIGLISFGIDDGTRIYIYGARRAETRARVYGDAAGGGPVQAENPTAGEGGRVRNGRRRRWRGAKGAENTGYGRRGNGKGCTSSVRKIWSILL